VSASRLYVATFMELDATDPGGRACTAYAVS
jgi:hypothetical protein